MVTKKEYLMGGEFMFLTGAYGFMRGYHYPPPFRNFKNNTSECVKKIEIHKQLD